MTKNSKRGRKFQDVVEYQRLAKMGEGESFFYEDLRPRDLLNVRRMCTKLEMAIVMRYTPEDPQYQQAGTRMWCVTKASKKALGHVVSHAEDDEL